MKFRLDCEHAVELDSASCPDDSGGDHDDLDALAAAGMLGSVLGDGGSMVRKQLSADQPTSYL
jgi:hypothetical protein